ncbi:MAG: aldehyde dehydrogenase [Opitutales bacterium]
MDAQTIDAIVAETLAKLQGGGNGAAPSPKPAEPARMPSSWKHPQHAGRGSLPGVFADAADAARAAQAAFEELRPRGLAARAKVVEIVKTLCAEKAEEWGKLEFGETQIGRLDHKIAKLQAIPNVPGVEWLHPHGMSGDHGITMEERSPFGVVCAITPVTHSIPTLSCNIINMVAAGNTVVINAHPGGARCAAEAVATFNRAIEHEIGIANVVTIVEKPTIESFNALCAAEEVALLCITGGPMVVQAALKSGKRAICAGPGNPPVVVDESADLDKAARDIIYGAAFDNNLLCIGEKQIFVIDAVYKPFLAALKRAGAGHLNARQLETLTGEVFTYKEDGGGCSHPVLKRELVGADATRLAEVAGLSVAGDCQMLFAETDFDHPFVQEEQMMPCLPVVRARNIEQAIHMAKESEHNYKHSAMIHTAHVGHMTAMGRLMDSTLFVKNGPCTAGLGMGGEGYASFSVATTTGEGITTPMTFTRTRRCVLVDALNIA